jgi:hypothetical protein
MAVGNGLQRLGRFLRDWGVGLRDALLRLTSIWWFLAGLVCVGVSVLLSEKSVFWSKFAEAVGIAFIIGVVVETIVRSIESLGLFEKELLKIIRDAKLSDELKKSISDVMYDPSLTQHQKELLSRVVSDDKFTEQQKNVVSQVILGDTFLAEQRKRIFEILFDPELAEHHKSILSEIIYDSKFLEGRKDLVDVWKKVSEVLYRNKFPEISDKINEKILTVYFPTNVDYYYDHFSQRIDVYPHEVKGPHGQVKYILAEERFNFTIKSVDRSQSVTLRPSSSITKELSDTVTTYELVELTINGRDRMRDCKIRNDVKDKSVEAEFSLELTGEKDYRIKLVQKKIYNPEIDGEAKVFTARHFIDNLEVHVLLHDQELEAAFFPMGIPEEEFESKSHPPSLIWETYKDLIFPRQGYRLIVRRR